ncbi:MAG TPA: acetylglutamate kinase [Chloroflexi bacterium]|nr:acetylglutamate kinase [Chloroflexota bacterium]
MQKEIIVVKIGGSTLGTHDTTVEDLVELQKQGKSLVVVHGGARVTSQWLSRLGIPTGFVNGLRVTDAETLKVVTAALGGLVNKELVVAIQALGGKAVGLSGCDGNLLRANIKSPELGYVGEIVAVDPAPLKLLLDAGYMPVVAPISLGSVEGRTMMLNVNGDTAAGDIAAALAAEKLVFLTDVDGIHDGSGNATPRLNLAEARDMLTSGVASGGMVPKIEASLKALTTTRSVHIIDGRIPHALLYDIAGQARQTKSRGTAIVAE